MIKKSIGAFFLLLGIVLLSLCLVLQGQFKALVADPEPHPGKYRLLDPIIQGSPSYSGNDPAELARSVSKRILAIGVGGTGLVLAGASLFFIGNRRKPAPGEG
jgi:hypothetical protein